MGETFKNAYDKFTKKLIQNKSEKYVEMQEICTKSEALRDFYYVCKAVTDISLNSKKIILEGDNVQGVFQEEDINGAKLKVVEFFMTYHIREIEYFVDVIEEMYPYAIEWDEKRVIRGNIYGEQSALGRCGKMYSFYYIPKDIWKELRLEFITELKETC